MRSCKSWKLYAITEAASLKDRDLGSVVAAALRGGADVIQLRDKKASDSDLISQARMLLEITRPAGVPLIVNDRPQVAKAAGADGLHLGQEDMSLSDARAIVGRGVLIGRSTHNPEQALAAENEGFDYIGVGPVFSTPTKPDYQPVGIELVRFAASRIRIPFVAIGGIDRSNASEVLRAGATCIAVVRAVMGAEDPEMAARLLRNSMKKEAHA